ncbi:3'-5' exonuclease [Pseudonocardia lacus]|uniref:3'-5' exonuclease n=1 Tax=Pseudonocardia lacus TaxID=2835865 RepID=UPI001BDBD6D7|nr:3'-5' exonuclease [Pseudonocardia lacus]
MTLVVPPVLLDRDIVVVDVEGNGQQPPEIIEIAVLPLGGGVAGDEAVAPNRLRTWLVRPRRPIAPVVTRTVHGISDRDVADSPTWSEVADEIAQALTDRVLVAHNAAVERRVLTAHLPDWRPTLVLDTLRLARTIWPALTGGYGLDRLIDHTRLTAPQALTDHLGPASRRHRAGYDTWQTAALLIALIDHARLDWSDLTATAALSEPQPARSDGDAREGGLW